MNVKRKAAPNGNGDPYAMLHNKGIEKKGTNQMPGPFDTDDIPPLAVVFRTLPGSKREQYDKMQFCASTGLLVVLRPDQNEPTLFEGRSVAICPGSDPSEGVCYLLEYYGIKRLELTDTPVDVKILNYCNAKGIPICMI